MADFEEDFYGDAGDDGDDMNQPAKNYEPADDLRVTQKPWFHGKIDRNETDRRLKPKNMGGQGLPGNFLVRQKDNQQFVHSYWSVSQKKVVHNLIKFQSGAPVLVDGKEFSARSLDEVVMKVQDRLKSWRKQDDGIPQQVVDMVRSGWECLHQPRLLPNGVGPYLSREAPGAFVVVDMPQGGHMMYINTPQGITNHELAVHPMHGTYLKYSEFLAPNLPKLIELLVHSADRMYAFGVPVPLQVPRNPPAPAGAPPRQQAPPPQDDELAYGAIDDEEEDDYGDGGDDDYGDSGGAPPPLPTGRPPALPPPRPDEDGDEYYDDGNDNDGDDYYDEDGDEEDYGRVNNGGGGPPALPPPRPPGGGDDYDSDGDNYGD